MSTPHIPADATSKSGLHRRIANRPVVSGQWSVVIVAVLILAGCATGPQKSELIPMFWPGPPDPTRIRFLTAFASEKDLGGEPGLSLLSYLTGKRPPVWHLSQPMGLAISDDGQRVYVSDLVQTLVYKFDLSTKKVTLIGEPTERGKPFDVPFGLALDGEENLYVVDNSKKAIVVLDRQGRVVRKVTPEGMERPSGIALDQKRGRFYVADTSHQRSSNHFVWIFSLEGRFLGKIGAGKGTAKGALLFPTYLTLDGEGNLYVADTMNARVQVFSPDGKALRTIGERGDTPGTFARPKGVALDSFGNLYVVDSDWANVQIFNAGGRPLLFFGGRGRYPGLLNTPTGIGIDKENRIYVADTQNLRVNVYQLVNTKAEDAYSESAQPPAKEGGDTGSVSHAAAAGPGPGPKK